MAALRSVCTLGRSREDGTFEVLANGESAVTTPTTRVEVTGTLTIGRTLRGELERRPTGPPVVTRLRSIEPDAEDATVLDQGRARVVAAGLADPFTGPSREVLAAAYQKRAWNDPVDPERLLMQAFYSVARPVPGGSGAYAADAIDEMQCLLRVLGAKLPNEPALLEAGRALERTVPSKAERRKHLWRMLAAAANQALAATKEIRRFHEFAPLDWFSPEEPNWMLFSPADAKALVEAKVFRRPAPG